MIPLWFRSSRASKDEVKKGPLMDPPDDDKKGRKLVNNNM